MLGAEPHVAGAQPDLAVGDLQLLQTFLGVAGEGVVLLVRRFGGRDFDHLHLVELVSPDESPRVAAVAPRLGAEARRERAVADGEVALL